MQQQRVCRELYRMSRSPQQGISVFIKDDIQILEAKLIGPDNTPYKEGIFNLEILIPHLYPFAPPSIKFITKVYHPNIDNNGRICLDLLKMPPAGNWKPTLNLESLLIAIRLLLEVPNPNDPLMADIADEYKNHYDDYVEKAKFYTEKYAR